MSIPCPRSPEIGTARSPRTCGSRRAVFFVKIGQNHLPVLDQIPFVECDDRCPAFTDDEIGNLQILLFKRDRRIEHDDDDFRKTDRTQAVSNRKLFELFLHARLAAQTGSIEQLDLAATPFPIHRDRVTGDACFRSGQQAVFAEHRIDERRLASVGSADNGDPQRLGRIIGRDFFFIRVFDVIADQFTDSLRRENLVGNFLFLLVGEDALFAQKSSTMASRRSGMP